MSRAIDSPAEGRGVFVTFEGVEGCGKSTQARLLADSLAAAGLDVMLVREPGGTRVGEMVRELLLDPASGAISPRCELLLYEASRAHLVEEVVEPALAAGRIVVCDRFFDSTTAYQGYARGIALDEIERLNAFASHGLVPDATLVFDIDAAEGLARATGEGQDRLESEEIAFHERVREGFLAIARAHPGRVTVIDATGSVDQVAARAARALSAIPALARGLGVDR